MLAEVLIPMTMFIAAGVILWKFFDSRHRLRMTIIERGMLDENLKYLYGNITSRPNRYGTLKWGLVAMFIGAALLVVIPLQQLSWSHDHEGELITGSIFLSGGIAFLLYYLIVSKREKDAEA